MNNYAEELQTSAILTAAASTDTKINAFIEGGTTADCFSVKARDRLLFNLFDTGQKDNEERNGAFEPPRDSITHQVVVITGVSVGLGLESAK